SRAHRGAARSFAQKHGVPFYVVECRADFDECRKRLRRRSEEPSVSDGRLEVFDDFVARWETIDEIDPKEHIVVDTSRPVAENERLLRERIPTWPPGLTR